MSRVGAEGGQRGVVRPNLPQSPVCVGNGDGTQASLDQSATGPSDHLETGAHMGSTWASTPSYGPRLLGRWGKREREGKGLPMQLIGPAAVSLSEGVSVEAIVHPRRWAQKYGRGQWPPHLFSRHLSLFSPLRPSRPFHSHQRTHISSTSHLSPWAHTSGPGHLFANSTPTLPQIFPRTVLTTPLPRGRPSS